MRRLILDVDGERVGVWAMARGSELWVHVRGQTIRLERGEGSRRASAKKVVHSTHPGRVIAPMPGKITRVLVQVGDLVSAGQALVVMEAMKMEYTLTADRDGRIVRLEATLGAQVGLHAALVEIGSLE